MDRAARDTATPADARLPAFAYTCAAACALIPALFAAVHVQGVADAAHDEGVVRVLGLGSAGALRALDAVVAAPLQLAPIGTRALRAGLASALVSGGVGFVAFRTARALLVRCAAETRLGLALAAVASLTATLSVAFQLEAGAVGGAMLGVLLALLPLDAALADSPIVGVGSRSAAAREGLPRRALLVGLALSYEPLVGATALAGLVAFEGVARLGGAAKPAPPARNEALRTLVAFTLGFAPLVLAVLRTRLPFGRGEVLALSLFASWAGERGASPVVVVKGAFAPFLVGELGVVVLALAAWALAVAALVPRARAAIVGVVALVAFALAAADLGAPVGPSRYGAPPLAALVGVCALAAVGMQSLVRAIATARVPFAQASATMVVVLLLALPVRAADDAALRLAQRPSDGAPVWDEVAFGALPPNAVVMVQSPLVMTRIQASRASGGFRDDLDVLPVFDLAGPGARHELAREPLLTPFLRDMALTSTPEEFSLATIAGSRPLVMTYDPRWERSLARHLVPSGLFGKYETEPRAGSDRRIALDAFVPALARLEASIAKPATLLKPFANDLELRRATAALLRARLVALAASHDRELLPRAAEDLRPFAADDAVAVEVLRRAATTRGAVDVKDLVP